MINTKENPYWKAKDCILVDTFEDLRNVAYKEGIVWIKCNTVAGDGGYGSFCYDVNRIRSDEDGGTVIADDLTEPTSSGCWVRNMDVTRYSLGFFGVTSDTTDNLTAERGTQGAVVNLSIAGTLSTYVFDEAQVPNDDQINNFHGWIKQAYSA